MKDWQLPYKHGHFVIIPDDNVRALVDSLRKELDPRSASICTAHITLTCPLKSALTEEALDSLSLAIRSIEAFEIEFGPVRNFPNSSVLYFAIQPEEPIMTMRKALHASDLFRPYKLPFEFVPHMTIREFPDTEISPERLEQVMQLAGGRFECSRIELVVPDEEFVFRRTAQIEFKGQEFNIL